MLQAMTASPENCANVPSPDGRETPVSVSHQGYDPNSAGPWGHYDPNVPPVPPYWNPEAWWGYYSPTPDMETQQQQGPPPQYWDPYSAMYAYMAEMNAAYGYPPMPYPPVYSPHHFAPPRSFRYPHSGSDSDECSGYSSTDEMAYYGAKFARGVPMMNGTMPPQPNNIPNCVTPSIVVTPTNENSNMQKPEQINNSQTSSIKCNGSNSSMESSSSDREQPTNYKDCNRDSDENETSDSDTEVEDENEGKMEQKGESGTPGLQMIRSVSDINIYTNNNSSSDVLSRGSETNDEETEREDDTEDDEDEDEEDEEDEDDERDKSGSYVQEDDCLPHQLSVIFEESEVSDAESVKRVRQPRKGSERNNASEDGDSSTATLDNADDESDVDYDVLDPASSTVTVRLPLKLKFSRSENDEEVTTVIVGDSQVKRSLSEDNKPTIAINNKEEKKEEEEEKEEEKITNNIRENPNVSVTLSFPSRSNSGNKIEQNTCDDRSSVSGTTPTKDITKSIHPSGVEANIFRQTSSDELDVYETCESDSDVSVCLSLPLKKVQGINSPRSTPPSISNISEEEDEDVKTKTEENDSTFSHWEDDSSSTSIQSVKLASDSSKPSGKEASSKTESNNKEEKSLSKVSTVIKKKENLNPNAAITHEGESDESDSEDESSTSSHSSKSCVSSKGTDSEKKTSTSMVSKVTTDNHEEEEEDESSEESDDSQDENEPDIETENIVSKLYNMCTESNSKQEGTSGKTVSNLVNKNNKNNSISNKSDVCKKEMKKDDDDDSNRRNSSKSLEESEEDDSGVTSDMSRQISDADTDGDTNSNLNELLTKCQRVATHSRLFKLLQDECGKSDDEDEDNESDEQLVTNSNNKCTELPNQSVGTLKSRKEHLTLPLHQNASSDPDSLSSSSGVTSPASPTVTDRLVKELVQSLLQRKKGRRLKKLPIAKLHAAALRILQEDMDPYDTVSSAGSEEGNNNNNNFYLPPVQSCGQPQHSNNIDSLNYTSQANNNTANALSPPNHVMYGTNYYDYCDYYDSWANAAAYYGTDPTFEYNIVPSRAFKLLQEHAQPSGFSPGVINGLWAKCPRIPSSKNIHKDLTATGNNKTAELSEPESSSSELPSEPMPQPLASTRAT